MESDFLKSVLEGMPIPAVLVGGDERILQMNTPACDLFGQGMTGRHVFTLLRQPIILESIAQVLRTGVSCETRYQHADQAQETMYRVLFAPVQDATSLGVLVSFQDITPLEAAGQMRRDFVANVSHELRTPLTAISGFIETLRGPAKDDPVARERFLSTMDREAGRMNRLVNDLLSLSRVESDERVKPTDLIDLKDIAESACHGLRMLAEDAGITLETSDCASGHQVYGDADQLTQVVTNLVENAMKYGGDGGKVDISISTVTRDPVLGAAGVQIQVQDFGAGIDPRHLHRLTERFYRADNHRSRELGGTGLGLAIVKHIMNRHRGRLKISSELEVGSCFSVIFRQPDQ